MADYYSDRPEIIPLEGVYGDLPELRELLDEDFGVVDRYFLPDDKKTLVSILHLESRPDTYSFVLQDEDSIKGGPRTVFDLVMGSEYSDFARLYTFRHIGENALKGLSKENGDFIFQAWHHLQVETGSIYPNPEDKALFRSVFANFSAQYQ